MADTTDPRIEDLIARQEVIEAIDELFIATDRKDWAAMPQRSPSTSSLPQPTSR